VQYIRERVLDEKEQKGSFYSMINIVIVAASTGRPPDLKAGGLEV
jgi:hypothetical protein